ncbi:MAG: beta-propeller domain-containing protein, partial [Clostridiales bacterium]|nr:beta-propeller domain-containing protein [Clostridiales bacterium]
EALGKTVFYDDGLVAVSDSPTLFDAARDAVQLADLRTRLTGAVAIGSGERLEQLLQDGGAYYYGSYAAYKESLNFRYVGRFTTGISEDFEAGEAAPPMPAPAWAGGGGTASASVADGAFPTAPSAAAAAPAPEPAPTLSEQSAQNDAKSSAPAAEAARETGSGTETDEFSATNIQVAGVDESDVVKTDGTYIYQVNGQRILIVEAYPPTGMKLTGSVRFDEDDAFTPLEMYVDGDTLVVIGSAFQTVRPAQPTVRAESGADADGVMRDRVAAEYDSAYAYPVYSSPTVRALVYDISDRSRPKLVRETEVEGNYKTSRKVGGALYLVANKSVYSYGPYYGKYSIAVDGIMPEATASPGLGQEQAQEQGADQPPAVAYRDTATADGAFCPVPFDRMYYFPGCIAQSYMVVAGIDTEKPDAPVSVQTVLDYGANVYASQNYLYVATQAYRNAGWRDTASATTAVHRFRLSDTDSVEVSYDGKGEVDGTILNQFSMDENDAYFRIATTSESYDERSGYRSENNLYVLDAGLKTVGRLTGLAPGEQIYSVRFLGARAYVVTFKTVDPLFVIDLSDPTDPRVLGALKIPGYSDYLHPYDETHIIGFGKDTVEYGNEWDDGRSSTAYYQGMKIALFDVSDVENPKEMFKTNIGDRGTDSELLRNHKALLFSRERELLAFPVSVMTVPENQKTGNLMQDSLAYGQFEFQGAYVYKLNLTEGFTLKGRITHISDEEYKRIGSSYWYGELNAVERLLYIRDTLYALSKAFITASGIDSPERETGRLALN